MANQYGDNDSDRNSKMLLSDNENGDNIIGNSIH